MEGKHFFILIVVIVASQFASTTILSRQLAPQETETIHVPIQSSLSAEQDEANPYPITAAIRLPTEDALRKLIRSALQKELAEIADSVPGINNTSSAGQTTRGNSRTTVASEETVAPEVRDEALSQSLSVIDQAIENGSWTDQDNQQLAGKIHMLDGQQRLRLINKLGEAMERGEVQLAEGVVPIL